MFCWHKWEEFLLNNRWFGQCKKCKKIQMYDDSGTCVTINKLPENILAFIKNKTIKEIAEKLYRSRVFDKEMLPPSVLKWVKRYHTTVDYAEFVENFENKSARSYGVILPSKKKDPVKDLNNAIKDLKDTLKE